MRMQKSRVWLLLMAEYKHLKIKLSPFCELTGATPLLSFK